MPTLSWRSIARCTASTRRNADLSSYTAGESRGLASPSGLSEDSRYQAFVRKYIVLTFAQPHLGCNKIHFCSVVGILGTCCYYYYCVKPSLLCNVIIM